MSQLDIERLYLDGDLLVETDLDAIVRDIEAMLNTTKVNDDNIQAASITASTKILDGSLTGPKFQAGAITAAKIAPNTITGTNIATGALTAAKIATGAAVAGSFEVGAVTTAKILDANVTAAKIADNNLDRVKFVALGQDVSNTTGAGLWNTTSTSYVDIDDGVDPITATITVTANPVIIQLIQGTTSPSTDTFVGASDTSFNCTAFFKLVRDPTGTPVTLGEFQLFKNQGNSTATVFYVPPSVIKFLDTPGAGTHTYGIQARTSTGQTAAAGRVKLIAYEVM